MMYFNVVHPSTQNDPLMTKEFIKGQHIIFSERIKMYPQAKITKLNTVCKNIRKQLESNEQGIWKDRSGGVYFSFVNKWGTYSTWIPDTDINTLSAEQLIEKVYKELEFKPE